MTPVNDKQTQVMTDLISVSSAALYLIGVWNLAHREGAGQPFGGGPKTFANGSEFSSTRFNSSIAALGDAPALAAAITSTVNEGVRTMLAKTSTQPVEEPPQFTCAQLRQMRNAIERELLTATPKEKASLEATLAAIKTQAKGCPE